ncbi:MAG: PepSY-like domain-containing protein [Altibacter sp.]|uniref:PepSY-like domain-containing protein n=1 Tax=Altibacter sp. TaxID=2024823 RepID=UPI001DCDE377|nr:PepSY-like domain-containing protein [Altibacter sp.]MBZ0327106.1 PepSY-like domain-containing protein [Altibacter sp.]
MKNLFVIALAILASVAMYGQDLKTTEVPSTFTEGLLKVYPNATDIEWERNGNDYKVEFDSGKMEHEIWFNKTGDMVRVQKDITKKELPTALAEIIKRDYADYTIDDVESIFKDGVTTYIVELEKGWFEAIRITFSTTGKVLNISKD